MRTLEQALFFVFVTTVAGAALAGDLRTDGAFISTKTDGPPLAVSSPAVATGLHADALDGIPGSNLPRSPANVVTVGVSGANFPSVEEALGSITDASAGNQYLISIGPGNFDDSAEDGLLVLPGHVHLQGSGLGVTSLEAGLRIEGPTRISSLLVGTSDSVQKAIEVAPQSSAWIDRVRARAENIGISCQEGATLVVEHTSIEVGLFAMSSNLFGVRSVGCSVHLRDVTIDVRGGGSFVSNSPRGLQLASFGGHHPSLDASDIAVRVVGGAETVRGLSISDTEPGIPVRIETSTIELVNSHSSEPLAVHLSGIETTEILGSSVTVTGPGIGVRIAPEDTAVVKIRGTEIAADEDTALEVDSTFGGGDAEVFVDHSELRGSPVLNNVKAGGHLGWFRHSHLDGGDIVRSNDDFFCSWVTDESFATFDDHCPCDGANTCP